MDAAIRRYGPGEAPTLWTAGDFLLTHNMAPWHSKQGFVSAMIRFGQRLRFRGGRRRFAYWNHAVAVCDGHLVEALGSGVKRSPLDKYKPVEFWYVATDLDASQRADFAAYVESQVGDRYGYLTIVSIAFSLVTGMHVGLSHVGQVICSGLVCAGLGIYRWRSDPAFVMPADLAEYHLISVAPR